MRRGYGRIEIITKPGTDQFHGGGSFQFQDKIFNTSTPFLGPTNVQPNYHQDFIIGNLTGPIRPGTSFTIAGTYRDIANNNIINPAEIYRQFAHFHHGVQPGRPDLRSVSVSAGVTRGSGSAEAVGDQPAHRHHDRLEEYADDALCV